MKTVTKLQKWKLAILFVAGICVGLFIFEFVSSYSIAHPAIKAIRRGGRPYVIDSDFGVILWVDNSRLLHDKTYGDRIMIGFAKAISEATQLELDSIEIKTLSRSHPGVPGIER